MRALKMFRDIRSGDVVQISGDAPQYGVSRSSGEGRDDTNRVDLISGDFWIAQGRSDQFVGVVHRPWPPGKSKEQMQDAILELVKKFPFASESEKDVITLQLYEAIEAYELGLPIDGK